MANDSGNDRFGVAFNPDLYRRYSLDLQALNMDDSALEQHFHSCGHAEQRIFGHTNSTAEFLSMKWLRGRGLEIGAGRYPTKLFGSAACEYADIEGGETFGSREGSHCFSIDSPVPVELHGKFDFVVASHVLEHADGIIRSILNLLQALRIGGVLYFVVPDRTYLADAKWMPLYPFDHHVTELESPGVFDKEHDVLAMAHMRSHHAALEEQVNSGGDAGDLKSSGGQVSAADLLKLIRSDFPQSQRFMLHKHTYDFNGWLSLFHEIQLHLKKSFEIVETRYGMERFDCHFVLKKVA